MDDLTALGLIELRSLSLGALVADQMLKTARVRLLFATGVSPGKFLVGLSGGVADVEAAVAKGLDTAGDELEDALFIPRVHPEVASALAASPRLARCEALGIVETASVAAGIRAVDAALKSAAVRLVSLRLAEGIGGKAVFYVSGSVADAQAAVAAGALAVRIPALLVRTVVIPQPHPDFAAYVIGPGLPGTLSGTAATMLEEG